MDVVPVEPNVPVIVDGPGQGVAEMLGSGTPMVVLSPGVPTSVAPSGIVLAPLVVPSPSPAEGVVAAPCEVLVAPVLQVLAIDEPDVAPPPSKVELAPAIPVPDGVIPEPVPAVPMLDVPVPGHNVPPASGLIPPVLSSVAPSGMPTGPDGALKFIVPSGDVAPMPGVGAVCANPLLQPRRKMAAVMARSRRMKASVTSAHHTAI
jgi:hypothetical protein